MKALLIALLIPGALILGSNTAAQSSVTVKDVTYNVNIADSDEERMKGLQNVRSMAQNRGMLFIFDEAKPQSFWMKDTLIPLDIIFINENLEVITIANAVPCADEDPSQENCKRYPSFIPAKYVLELNAGQSSKINLQKGDKLIFNLNE